MKYLVLSILVFFTLTVSAQTPPQGFTYQAVARNSLGNILPSTPMTVRLSIINTSPSGTLLYQETHQVTTNPYGLFTVIVGQGTQTGGGVFTAIPWSVNAKFIKVEVNMGGNYDDLGTSQLWSVPYALYTRHAAVADTLTNPAGTGGTLDYAYDFGGPGAGRTITVDNGPVQINASGTNTAGLGILMTGTGNSINTVNNNAANQYAVIQAQTNSSTVNNSAVFGISTGAARAISGEVQAQATASVAVRGNNLRTNGGIGVEGVGFNGVSGQTNYSAGIAVYGENFDQLQPLGNGVGVGGRGYLGVVGEDRYNGTVSGAYGVYSNGNFAATGVKSFRIDHPQAPANKYLVHFSIESDEVLNMYRGTVTCDANGEAQVALPAYFPAVNIHFSYHLTPVGMPALLYIKRKIENGTFVIAGGQPGMEVCWQVIAERNDPFLQANPHIRENEPVKNERDTGKYLMPYLYGQPAESGIFFRE